jgi:ketosteroid isomerase-like protein
MPDTVLTHTDAAPRDLEVLEELNRGYVRAAELSDVRWYAEHLAEDYVSIGPDGSLTDRAGFLARIARPYPGSNPVAVDVRIRLLGDIALIHAGFRDTRPDGRVGEGRYTDIWARRGGRWLCISAHFTRW